MEAHNLEEFSGRKVLVVDDGPHVVRVLRRFLEAKGLLLLEASNAEEALRNFSQERPRVVFLDIGLPDRNGLEILQEIHRMDPEVAVIMITGGQDDFLESKALKIGACSFLTEPFDFKHLERVLWEQLKSTSLGGDTENVRQFSDEG